MKTLRRATLILALSITAFGAETVYFSPKGKTFHRTETCMALSRAATVYHADRAAAEGHKLVACGICWRKQAEKKSAANDWAKPQGEKK